MLPGASGVVVLVICASMSTSVFAQNCKSYRNFYNAYQKAKECQWGSFCCGLCENRECCWDTSRKLDQERCDGNTAGQGNRDSGKEFNDSSHVSVTTGTVITAVLFLLLLVCCCICPCCCIYKKPTAVQRNTQHCKSYKDIYGVYHLPQECTYGSYCCGLCEKRECCYLPFRKLDQERCDGNTAGQGTRNFDKFQKNFSDSSHVGMITGTVVTAVLFLLCLVCCCICPCCCIYKMCRRPQPVVASTTHTTVVTSAPQQYPQQPMSVPGQPQPYQATQYPPYQPMPVQPGYGTQPMATSPYPGQAFTPGPPPPYQDAIGPAYPPTQPMPYSQAAYNPGQPAYPLHPPTHPQPNAPSSHADFLAQPAYNPDYVAPPKTG